MPTTVITGCNRGIGLELVRQCKQRGDAVVALCRGSSPDLEALGVEVVDGIDVASGTTLERLRDALGGRTVELLINNAGVLSRQSLETLDIDAIRYQFEVNALGPLRVTTALMENLAHNAKVALVTSRMGSIADNTSGSHYGYRMSKAALNIAGVSLAEDLRERGIAVILLHPGYVNTDMTNHGGSIEPAEAASGLLARIEELDLSSSGCFRHANGEALPW